MTRPITDASDHRHVMADGYGWLLWELEPDGRVRVTGSYGPTLPDSEAAYGSTHSTKTIAELIQALTGMVGRAERES